MFLVRRAQPEDVGTLLKLAKMVHFINLPADRGIIEGKVSWSRQCFMLAAETQTPGRAGATRWKKPARGLAVKQPPHTASSHGGVLAGGLKTLTGRSPLFMFALEEVESGGVIGTSQIISRMGGPGQPNISLQLARKEMFSTDLQTGVSHTVFRRHLDESSPTEIGGLILQPSFRGHRLKLGRLISLVRFHYIGLYRQMFADRVIAELMGPMSADGHVPFWEHFGRHFINMTYDQADRFCQESKEFMISLLPSEDIYLTLLVPEARAAIGSVDDETKPAKHLLERLGFAHFQRVDPFDGGPHLEAQTDMINLVRQTRLGKLATPTEKPASLREHGIVSVVDAEGEFRATASGYQIDKVGRVVLPGDVARMLGGKPGMDVGFSPLETGSAVVLSKPPIRARK